ncbi:MAG: HD-GYP domain-containing protein [Treponemataceae bacterium]|uniref:HD-GYP domain-containing protein n=1 Tax=Treponema sp. J25 TaxID=2094121 RepID=UPI0010503425|nr:HD-GYP domain-containing protein [Treponema sp. J25]MCX7948771.1 HD-GYP domain-containing protein [Treponemataceae bacterium]TCW62647.1 HD-GYP domain-containing protein [Treponema sp. J25]
MESMVIKNIPAGYYFTKPTYLDGQFILTTPEIPFKQELIQALLDWEFREIYTEGELRPEYSAETGSASTQEAPAKEGAEETEEDDKKELNRTSDYYHHLIQYVENLFVRYATKKELSAKEIAEKVKELCEIVRQQRRFILRSLKPAEKQQNFLVVHTVNSTIIAIVIGLYLKLPNHRLIELGTAALLHEIGMLKLPPQLYMANRPLTVQERKAILSHPILSYNILKAADFPLNICVAVLEHHERENGEGYPQKLTAERISLYAKIIAVACSYEALTAPRPYKDAKNGYAGMIDLLKNVGKQYDDTVVRALVYSLSIYPIGLYVLLSNGKRGQVVDVNPENPRFPVVQILGEQTPDGKNKVIETSQEGVHVLRPLVKEEIPLATE